MLRIVGLSLTMLVSAAAQRLVVQDVVIPALIGDASGNASTTLTLKNTQPPPESPGAAPPAAAEVPLELRAELRHKLVGGTDYPLNTALTVAGVTPDDEDKLKKKILAANAQVRVKLTFSQIGEGGEAELLNAGRPVYFDQKPVTLHALRLPAAYNLQFEATNPEATFGPDSRPVVRLVNRDSVTYQFGWELLTRDGYLAKGKDQITIPANATVDLDLSSAALRGFWFASGTLKDDLQDALLILRPVFHAAIAIPPQPDKRLPLKVRLRFYSRSGQEVAAFFWTLVLLCLGAWLSLIFRIYIPNATGAYKLKRQLNDLDEKIKGTGDDLPSQWRVLLRWRLETCRVRLREEYWFLPGFTTSLAELQTRVEMYAQWVEIAYRTSVVIGDAKVAMRTGIPPSLFCFLEERCCEALAPIATGFTSADELQGMKTSLRTAEEAFKAFAAKTAIPALEAVIREREKNLGDVLIDLKSNFPEFCCTLDDVASSKTDDTAILPKTYFDRDTLSFKADLLRAFRDLEKRFCSVAVKPSAGGAEPAAATGIDPPPVAPQPSVSETSATIGHCSASPAQEGLPPTLPPAAPAGGSGTGDKVESTDDDGTAGERLARKRAEFIHYLIPDSHGSLQVAKLFIWEMRQDFYPKPGLYRALRCGEIEIHVQPQSDTANHRPQAMQSGNSQSDAAGSPEGTKQSGSRVRTLRVNRDVVQFALRFRRELLNETAARQEWTCEWDFGDGTEHEKGWVVFHRFSEEHRYTVTVTLMSLDGKTVSDIVPDKQISAQVDVCDDWEEAVQRQSAGRLAWAKRLWKYREKFRLTPEAKLELIRTVFVLGIALAGVFVTARGKVEELDVFQGAGALIGLGFAADTLKTLLTPKPDEK